MKYDVKNIKLSETGYRRINWADNYMPVLGTIRERFSRTKPLKGIRIGACLHVTTETANLMRTLQAGGAQLALCASNPLSTQDETAASLVRDYKIPTFAVRGENNASYYRHINAVIATKPHITIDDGADLVSTIHSKYPSLTETIYAGMEETTTGIIRMKAMAQDGALRYPVFSVNDAKTKYLFDNRYGTGQSTVDGIIRATNVLLAGGVVVVAGYGWCGRGFATRARGLGARVIVTEINPLRALEATMDGFNVMPMDQAAKIGDVFCTLTGDISVINAKHFKMMKDGAIVANSGHFNVELDLKALEKLSRKIKRNVRPNVDEYILPARGGRGKSVFVLAQGRLVNLACAEGHPAMVMDMSFATQALVAEYAVKHHTELSPQVYDVPSEIEDWIARLKLESMGIKIDSLTPEQKKYLASWSEGT